MRILIIGSGGREHALLWKLRADAPDAEFFATRPNGGMAALADAVDRDPADVDGIATWAAASGIDLAVVGPEAPLAHGIVDRLQTAGVPAFGPTAAAARIESSKAFAKDLMAEAGIPTADYRTFEDFGAASSYIDALGAPVVVKASGLAAGKGAVVCETVQDAKDACRSMLEGDAFGEAGHTVLVEEFMQGEELSVFALTDGESALTLLPSQDHKRIGEGDTGPNTGGMGAYAPVALATSELLDEVNDRILEPTLRALSERDSTFRGLLYAGLMITDEGPRVVEFNCRFGDPETQVVVPLMEGSLLDLVSAVAAGETLAGARVAWKPAAAVTTVLASEGYPGRYEKGLPLHVPEEVTADPDVILFHAGTRRTEHGLVTAGGRVLAVTGLGATLQDAAVRSRKAAAAIDFRGKYHRTDIGWREFARDEAIRP